MSAHPLAFPGGDVFGLGLDEARREWRRFLAWGLILAGAGAAAVGLSAAADPQTAWLFGGLLLVGGAVQVATAVRAWEWGGLGPRAVTGLLYLALGAVTAGLAGGAAVWLTLVLAAGLIVGGGGCSPYGFGGGALSGSRFIFNSHFPPVTFHALPAISDPFTVPSNSQYRLFVSQ